MLLRIFLIGFLSTKIYSVPAQQENKTELFKEGIHLENPNLTIPWNLSFNELSKYGNPKIILLPKRFLSPRFVKIQWDSIKIFNGILASIFFTKPLYLMKKMDRKIKSFEGNTINSFKELVSYFQNYSTTGKMVSYKKGIYYYWFFLSTYVRVGRTKTGYEYFIIQKLD